jgi:hypothetical protein
MGSQDNVATAQKQVNTKPERQAGYRSNPVDKWRGHRRVKSMGVAARLNHLLQ